MLRRWLTLLLLMLQLQPVMAFMPEQVVTLAQTLSHEWVHNEGQGHRHDDTLGVTSDDASTALTHVHHDAAHHAVLLPVGAAFLSVVVVDEARTAFGPCRLPSPCLDGPLRPPR